MSAFEHSSTASRHIPAARKLRVTVAQLFLKAVLHWQRSRAIRELHRLSDEQLNDIGISRGNISGVVDGLFSREEIRAVDQEPSSTPEERMRMAA